ncbi:hypothetical protein M2272_000624 [Mycobacterium frederiksbergense]|uniref:SRPBCC family protein n=1 Tax=Mycolicibacterium frederiksbergense TaxID=117567 RepID=A0ABT6KTD9_9MYCO|nr:hypothetical protein [Mycolicibacterium frederiksbergense]
MYQLGHGSYMSMVAARVVGVTVLLYAARRYYRNWGTTKEECRCWLLGDELVRQPSTRSTEGVWIDAPPPMAWPWLTRLLRSDGELVVGDVVHIAPKGRWDCLRRASLVVDQVVAGEAVVLRGTSPDFPWDAVWSFRLQPRWEDRCRLLLRMRAQLRHPGDVLKVEIAGPAVALMMRSRLRTIKHRAESAMLSTRLEGAS